jgi:hypothetical protein
LICRIDLYEIKARLRRANGLRAALRAVLGRISEVRPQLSRAYSGQSLSHGE